MKYVVTLNGKNYEVEVAETEATVLSVTDAPAAVAAPVAAPAPAAAPAPVVAPAPAAAPVAGDGEKVLAPMPGTVLGVKVNVGDAVKAGDVVVVLEAMKMENDIVAPCDGTVKQILVQKTSTVNTDDVLAVIG